MDRVLEEVVVEVDHLWMSGQVGEVDGQEEQEDRVSSLSFDLLEEEEEALLFRLGSSA